VTACTPLTLGTDGWLRGAQRRPSPHFDARPAGTSIDLLLLHNISLPPGCFNGDAIERLFLGTLDCRADPFYAQLVGLRVSAHFLIRRDGSLLQFVGCHDRAWHAGVSCFEGRTSCNDYSLGVELEGTDFIAFAAAQYRVLAELTSALRTALPLAAVRGHSEVAAGRKTDPGPFFDWPRYLRDAVVPAAWRPAPPDDAAPMAPPA
jgi:AmpD protein